MKNINERIYNTGMQHILLRKQMHSQFEFLQRFKRKSTQPAPFAYLERYEDPILYSSRQTIIEIVENIAVKADEKQQVVLINGPLGAGKTTTRKKLVPLLRDALGKESVAVVTTEQGLRSAVPLRKSGFYKKEDYAAGTTRFGEMIREKISDPKVRCLVIEAPAMGGFHMRRSKRRLLGMDRGVTELVNLFGPKGTFRNMVDIYGIGISRKNIRDAYRKRFEESRGRRVKRTEGGSWKGMVAAEQDMRNMLAENSGYFAAHVGIPPEATSNFSVNHSRITASVLSWFYKDYLQLPKTRVVLCSNRN